MPEPRSTTRRRASDLPDTKESVAEGKQESLMHSMKEGKTSTSFLSSKLFIFVVIAALLGVGTGYFLSQNGGKTGIATLDQAANSAKIKKGSSLGSDDVKTFKDTAEGTIKKGGVDGEGSHSLIRPGGESQTVCLTSSHVDMDELVGRKVKVWGQTNSAETCGWLMDVGKIEVLN